MKQIFRITIFLAVIFLAWGTAVFPQEATAGDTPSAEASPGATPAESSAPAGISPSFNLSTILKDPSANPDAAPGDEGVGPYKADLRFATDGTPILSAGQIREFSNQVTDQVNTCIANREQMNSEELQWLLGDDSEKNFYSKFLQYIVCQNYVAPNSGFCDPDVFLGLLPNAPSNVGFKWKPMTEEQKKESGRNLQVIGDACTSVFYYMHLLKGTKEIGGKAFPEANCDFSAANFGGREPCEQAISAFMDATDAMSPDKCKNIPDDLAPGKYVQTVCQVVTSGNLSPCDELESFTADMCKISLLVFRGLRSGEPVAIDYLSTGKYSPLYAAAKADTDKGYCSDFLLSEVQAAFCEAKYRPLNFDAQNYYSSEIEKARTEMEEEKSGETENSGEEEK